MKHLHAWWLSLTLLLLAACGGGAGSETPPAAATEVASGQSAQQALGTGGGSVTLATREGARFELVLPDGALPEGATVSLTTASATPSQRFVVRLAPAGTVLLKPATITVTLPAAMALPAAGTLTYDGVPLAVTRLPDGRLQAQISHFAGSAATAGTQKQAQAASVPPACGGVPDFSDGGFTASAAVGVEIYGQCMVGAVEALAATGQYAEAARVAAAVAAYLQSTGSGDAAGFVARAGTLACAAYREAAQRANTTPVTAMGALHTVLRPVLFWEKTTQQLGAACSVDYTAIATAKTSEAMAYYIGRKGTIVDATAPAYTEAVAEAREGKATVQQVQSLPGAPAVNTLAKAQHEERAQPGLLDAMLQAPWQRCRDSGNFDKLIELMQLMDGPQAVKSAAQYCGTQLAARGTAAMDPAIGGVSAGRQVTAGSVSVQADGQLQLSGPIRALQCPAGSAGGSESLQIRLGSTVLQTLTAAPYLASTLEIDIAGALRAANLEAATFTGATLTLHRMGSPCGGFWGDSPQPLLTLDLSGNVCVPPAGRDHCVTVLADLDSSDRDFHSPIAISNRNGHVYLAGIQGGSTRASIWNRGRVTALPDDFYGFGGRNSAALALADDGSVAGIQVSLANDGITVTSFMPAVFNPASGRLTELLDNAVQVSESMPQANWSGYGLVRSLGSMTISPQGRVTFTVFEEPNGYGWAGADLGWCGQVRLSNGTGWDCYRYRRYEARASGSAKATTVQTLNTPSTGDLQEVMFDGDGGIGRFGTAVEFYAQEAFGGGIGGYRIGQPYRARELAAETPRTYGRHRAADRFGRTLTDTADGLRLLPSGAAVPSGWVVGALGIEGHLQTCTAAGDEMRVIDLNSGRTLMNITGGTKLTHQGRQVEAYGGCSVYARPLDSLGRLLGRGFIESADRDVPLVFTPAGVALP